MYIPFDKKTYCIINTFVMEQFFFGKFLSNVAASQMWCLFRFLPIIIGERIDVEMEEWHCLLILWNIVQICTSPAIRKDDIPYLRILIEEHHTLCKRIYPNASIIPKMRFLVYVPDDIAR